MNDFLEITELSKKLYNFPGKFLLSQNTLTSVHIYAFHSRSFLVRARKIFSQVVILHQLIYYYIMYSVRIETKIDYEGPSYYIIDIRRGTIIARINRTHSFEAYQLFISRIPPIWTNTIRTTKKD